MPPSTSEKQKIAMRIAAAGKSNIGIPQSVGKEFVKADQASKSGVLTKGRTIQRVRTEHPQRSHIYKGR